MTKMTRMTRMTKMTKMASMTRVMRKDMDEYYDQDDQGGWLDDEQDYQAGHLIGCDKKSEIVQYFQGRLCDKIGLLCNKYVIFSGLIYIVLPGFKGEKPL